MFKWVSFLAAILISNACAGQASTSLKPLDNGIEGRRGGISLRITALTDTVLRVQESNDRPIPNDGSWAVLSSARASEVPVVHRSDGFDTTTLRVSVSGDLRISITDLQGHSLQRDLQPATWTGSAFRLHKQKAPDDHFFGLGDKPGPLDRAGQSYVMWNSDTFGWQESTDPIYKSIPFFMEFRAGHALGVLFDNTWRTSFDFGHEAPNEYSFGAPAGALDYYLLYGPEPRKVVEEYAWLTGPTPLPPLWSLGFQQSRYSYETESRLLEVASRLRADHIPADALSMDIDYQVKNRPFTINEDTFPRFSEMVKKLASEHFHLVMITDLHIAHLPDQGYLPYDSGVAGDHFVKNPDGSTYIGPVWPGPSVFPDFTQRSSRDWWGTLYKEFVADGVSGFWNDMNEPAVFRYPSKTMPDDVQHRLDEPGFQQRTASHLEVHNVYGMENSRATYEGLLRLAPNERPFVLTRATYAGGQRYAATWTGDNSSTWNHLRLTTPQLLNLGLSGFAMAGADVGGFAGSPSPDLLTKWIEIAAFQPIDRDHAAKGTRDHEPWVDGPEHESIRRRFIEERYRLMPYLYTTAEEASHDGMPIIRPLFLEFPNAANDGHPIDLDAAGEFLFGPDLLIAPNPSPEEVAPYEVHLPPGTWYDYWTGIRLDRGRSVTSRDLELRDQADQQKPLTITPTLAELPVYVRSGSILPIQPLVESTAMTPDGHLSLRAYLDEENGLDGHACSGSIYQDDGHTRTYRDGNYTRIQFSCRLDSDGSLHFTIGKQEGSYLPWWHAIRLEVYGWTPRKRSATSGSGVQRSLQKGTSFWAVEIPGDPNGTELTLR